MKKALTQSRIDALDHATTLRDPSLKGFAVRVYPASKKNPDPAKSYGLVTKSDSGKESFTPLPEEFRDAKKVPLAKAYREAARLLLGEAGAGGIKVERALAKQQKEVYEATKRTFKMVLDLWWLETADTRPQATTGTYRTQIDKRILPLLGDKLLTDIRTSDIVRLRDTNKRRPASANMSVHIVSRVFNFAAERGDWVAANPAYKVKPLPEKGHQVHLSDNDIKRLYQALSEAKLSDGTPDPARLPLMLAAVTGCRIGEAETITDDEIRQDDKGRWHWYLSAERTKQKREHINWLVTSEHLMLAKAAANAFDIDYSKKDRRNRTRSLFNRIAHALGLPKCGAHVFRRATVTEQLKHDMPQLVQKRIGHANIATTMGYENKVSDEAYAATKRQAERRGL